ncbi:eukaryotic translation initiation factor 5B isoform X2 [Cylas formicarius]|uniref:eukaryotic translation initiation factor 5B isoform X2 n=1 Tax=Cylas formicarius TaxID=197179 RepID=UPI0029588351|nr:eukaryotic translation initiation factor 5B isoform X2 [Cylas formicarius]
MVKAKKQERKGAKSDESDSEIEIDTPQLTDKTATKQNKSGKVKEDRDTEATKSKKSKSKGKKQEIKAEDSEDDTIPIAKGQKSFAILQIEDNDLEDEPMPNNDSDDDIKTVDKSKKKANESKTKEQGGKKGKKGRKRADSVDEIEKALAELEMEYAGIKKEGPEMKEESRKPAKVSKDKNIAESVKPDYVKEESEEIGTVKTAAQKKREKKEREKQTKLAQKTKHQNIDKESSAITVVPNEEVKNEKEVLEEKESKKKKKKIKDKEDKVDVESEVTEVHEEKISKKKKGGKEKDEKETKNKKGPAKKTIAAMQEALRKIKEEEERLKREEEDRIKREEEAERARLEALKLEQERKDKKKQKEKERKERLKAEGKLLTAKQKADRARAQALIDSLKAKGVELPDVGERKPRLGTRVKPSKQKKETSDEVKSEEKSSEQSDIGDKADIIQLKEETKVEEEEVEGDDVKDTWDASSSDSESEETESKGTDAAKVQTFENDESEEGSSEGESEEESESESEDEDDEEELKSAVERSKERAEERIMKRKEEAERNRTVDNLRAAVVCVLGHVDTGKTKILDKLRRTNVQDGEAGGITQQIGATNVPVEAIKEQIKIVKGANEMELKVPGLLIIDTPGHESFSNLRNRGSSLCDIAILVVDIMHGLEPQTIESINLLKNKKCPFIVALNKIDRLYDWQTMSRKDVRDILKAQASNTQLEFDQRSKSVVVQFAEQGLNAALFYENPDPRTYISLVPTSAITGEGMGNLLALIVDYCQTKLPRRLMYSDELQATVLEVKAIPGLGTTIDVILVNGRLREGETMLVAGTDGPIVTQIRSLLMPQPLRELRVKNAYMEYKEVRAAQGVKIAAKELDKAIAGLNLYVAHKPDEIDVLRDEVSRELRSALSNIKLQERGVYVQASTLGSLEALLEFLRVSKIPYAGIRIGPVVKKDVMKASIMLEHDPQYATILAFDVKIEKDAQELADSMGVKIFQADIIYHLFDKFTAYREELKQRKRDEFKHIAVFPCKLRVLPQFVFNSRDPIVCGVMVEAGIVKEGTPICVPSKEFLDVGVVTSIESNHKPVENARKGMEICIKIEPIPGEAPKMFGRHFDETDMLVSKISRQSIDACKDYFRDDLLKTDWQLMVELKKLFQIL